MNRQKKWNNRVMLLMAFVLVLTVSACAAADDEGDPGAGDETLPDHEGEEHNEHDDHAVDSFMHIHGLAYDPTDTESLYMATHHGLIHIDTDDHWQWTAEEAHRHDLMGFTITGEGEFIASGHPAEGSDLEDPLGVVVSDDKGRTWEPIALHGEVDFHVLEVNAGDPTVMYGLNTYGADQGLYRSEDGGENWEAVQGEGLPDDLNEVYAIISDPQDAERLLAGTVAGVLSSADEGRTWSVHNVEQTISGVGAVGDTDTIVAYLIGKEEGLNVSDDFGESWNYLDFTLEDDAVSYVAVEPNNTDVITVGTYGEDLYRTKDGGETWEQLADGGEPLNSE